ncbi:hypothetical protein GWK47_022772 [Chionoecetes opilio]|uniref:Uncharacterized protein n=1 Tax=Chionoecetes opilio TaxID=41210 RepID=A0A8J4XRZ2_CHIOP|nr:hypothetical protein GWK47_022772 [Chionoecetes opilio]
MEEPKPPSQPPQASPQPVVLVVNPASMDPTQRYYARQPYLNRGAQFSNGCRCLLPHMILLCTLGGMILFIGVVNTFFGLHAGVIFLVPGGILLGLGIYLIVTAKRQFDSLPSDHPDRAKYCYRSIYQASGPTVYAVPPLQNQVMANPAHAGGQVYHIMPVPQGTSVPTSAGLNGVQYQYIAPGYIPPGRSTPQGAYVPENDLPPAYSDVVHNV